MTGRARSFGVEGLALVLITVVIGAMAGAASFTHMHDWTMANSPAGTAEWFGWANAVVSELTPTASVLVMRRRRLRGQSIGFPVLVLLASVALSLSAQFAQAKPSVSGWLLAAVPALGFLAMTKLVLGHTVADEPADPHPAPVTPPVLTEPAAPLAPPAPDTPELASIEPPALATPEPEQHTDRPLFISWARPEPPSHDNPALANGTHRKD